MILLLETTDGITDATHQSDISSSVVVHVFSVEKAVEMAFCWQSKYFSAKCTIFFHYFFRFSRKIVYLCTENKQQVSLLPIEA